MQRRDSRHTNLQIEALETRHTMTAGITAVLAGDVLAVTGTDAADQIEVIAQGGVLNVADSANHQTIGQFSGSAVKKVVIDGGAGDDTIQYKADLPATLIGGAGEDRLVDHDRTLVRPTLLVVIHGFWLTRDSYWKEWDQHATALRDSLEQAGSRTVTWTVDWESLKSPDAPEAELERKIRKFLGQQSETWDLFVFGHSRGAVMAANLANSIEPHAHLGNVQAVLLDPTASNLQGDIHPVKLTSDASVSQYDDRYVLAPVVDDSYRIRGADYHDVRDEMKPYFKAHQGNARWIDAHEKAASAVEKAIQWTGAYSEYLGEVSALSHVLAGVVAQKDAVMSHVLITDWYLQSEHLNDDLRDFVGAKQFEDFHEVTGTLAIERVHLQDGSAKVTAAGMVEAFVNSWRWSTDLGLSAAQNLVDGAGEIIKGTVAGWFPRESSTRANLQTLGDQILGFSSHWFGLARKFSSDLHRPMSEFLVNALEPVVVQLASRDSLAARSDSLKSLADRLTGPEMVGHNLARVLRDLPATKLVRALEHVSGTMLKGFLANSSTDQLLRIAKTMDARDIRRVLEALPLDRGLALLNQLPVASAAQAVLEFDWSGRMKWLGKLNVDRVANIVWKFDWDTRITALNKMDAGRVADVIWVYDWNRLIDTLGHMSVGRVADVIWKYDWERMINTLGHMSAGRAADVIWQYDWERMISTLGHMSAGRAADVIWQYDWERMISTLSRMSLGRVADVVWQYDWERMIDTLNHMDLSWAAKVVSQYSSGRMMETLNHMSSGRKTEILRYLGKLGASVNAGPVQVNVSTSGGSISVGRGSVSW